MNDGRIEQFGTREEVYYYPNNLFVAHFIGNPSINVLDAELEELSDDTGRVTTYEQSIEFAVDRRVDGITSGEVLLGFRPQAVRLGDDVESPLFERELLLVEPVDDRALARLDGPEGELRAIVPSNQLLVENELTKIGVDRDQLYLFDAETTELIATSGDAPSQKISRSVDLE